MRFELVKCVFNEEFSLQLFELESYDIVLNRREDDYGRGGTVWISEGKVEKRTLVGPRRENFLNIRDLFPNIPRRNVLFHEPSLTKELPNIEIMTSSTNAWA